jgi:hypothetical protein
MFSRKPSPSDPRQEIERRQVERAMAQCEEELAQMAEATPSEAERIHQRLKSRCADKRLDFEFKRKILEKARKEECHANMRATDRLLREALHLAADEQMKERTKKMSEARKTFSKASMLGADADFRRAAERKFDTVLMTGGVHRPGPTVAKPADTAPRNPNQAKV